MKLGLNFNYPNNNINKSNNNNKYGLKLKQLNCDTVSFTAMKKNQFQGIDLMIVNKFKALIEKFNTNDEFQNWCSGKVNEITENKEKICESTDIQAGIQKEAILNEWIEYVTKENDAYTPAIQLLILSSITSSLDINTNHLPPNLNKGILASVIQDITDNCKQDKNYNANFDKLYRNKLFTGVIQNENNIDESLSGWIIIPSKDNDPDNFEDNVKKLQTLSYDSWCTKTYNAEPYLSKGDFHIYLENGKPKLGVRFDNDIIQEIQGEKNNTTIPVKYLDIAKAHVKENNYELNDNTRDEFEEAEEIKKAIKDIEAKLKEQGATFKTASTKQLFDVLKIKYKETEDGKLILEKYRQPDNYFSFDDLGINENKLFKDIVEIKGDINFGDFNVTNLGNLTKIGGDVDFGGSKITNLGNLKSIGGDVNFSNFFGDSIITNLGNLEYIGGNADFSNSQIKDIGNLKNIGKSAFFQNSKITSLKKLENIGEDAHFFDSEVTDLGNLHTIGKDADIYNSNITSLNNLQHVGGNLDIRDSKVESLGKLKTVGGNLYLKAVKLLLDANLEHVSGDIISKKYHLWGDVIDYINKARKFLKTPYKMSEIFTLHEAGLSDNQMETYAKYRLEGIKPEEAAYLASFSVK